MQIIGVILGFITIICVIYFLYLCVRADTMSVKTLPRENKNEKKNDSNILGAIIVIFLLICFIWSFLFFVCGIG